VLNRYVSDTARANWSSLISAFVGVGLALGLTAIRGDLGEVDPLAFGIDAYLLIWPAFAAIYLLWTHRAYSRPGPRALAVQVERERAYQGKWWSALLGYGGASSWTLMAAIGAVGVTVLIAQDASYRGNLLYVALGLLCVAGSWALMVYAFALQYMRLGSSSDREHPHIVLGIDGDIRFADYLTLAVLLSTMAATVSADIRSREAWGLVRTNVLFAFTFNSVIVAMVVSLLLGGLVSPGS